MKFKLIITLIVGLAFSDAFARTDVTEQLGVLKQNHVNSSDNYNQYKENYNISKENLKQSKIALKKLKNLKNKLAANTQNVQKNKLVLKKMTQKISEFKQAELNEISKEQQKIEQLQSAVLKLEALIEKRNQNVAAYDEKLGEIEEEKQNWETQKAQLAEINQTLDRKIASTSEDQKVWTAKKADYKTEAVKWNKQAKILKKNYIRIKRLAE